MAANSPAKASPYGENDQVSYAELNTIHTQAYQSVNRHSTISAWKSIPLCYSGGTLLSVKPHWHGLQFDNDDAGDETPSAYFDISGLPDGHVIDGIKATFYVPLASVHVSGLPSNMPYMSFLRTGLNTRTTSTLATVICDVATEVSYDLGWALSTSFTPVTIDKSNYRYFVYVSGESGSGSTSGLGMAGIQAHITVDTTEGGPDFLFW